MSVQKIILAMKQLNKIHLDMLQTGQEKQRAIIANNTEALTKYMTMEARMLKNMNEAEEERAEAVNHFLIDKGIRSQLNLTVTELTRLVFDPDEKRELLTIRDELITNASELKKQNEATQQLLEQSLTFIDFSLNVLVGIDDEMVYQKPTDTPTKLKKNNYFDAKA